MLLVLDNYDSFTYNLVQYLGELKQEMVVRRNDELSVADVEQMAPERIVISPGPCTPDQAGISVELIQRFGPRTPILGVCLGHQAIAQAYGGTVVRSRRVMHGKTSPIRYSERGEPLFVGIPNPFTVARYHSLSVDPGSVPAELEVVAWTDEGGWEDEVQALRHREHPVWGVQFHPESIASEAGMELLANFLAIEPRPAATPRA